MSFCEDFLMNRLFTESEEAEMKEEREKAKFRKVQAKIVSLLVSISIISWGLY